MKLTDYLFEGTDEVLNDVEKALCFTRNEAKEFIRENLKKIALYKLKKDGKDIDMINKIINNEDISSKDTVEYIELFKIALHVATNIKFDLSDKNIPGIHYDKPILDSDYRKTINYLTSMGLSFTEFDYDPKTEDKSKWKKTISINGFRLLISPQPTSIEMHFNYEDESLCNIFCGAYSCLAKN